LKKFDCGKGKTDNPIPAVFAMDLQRKIEDLERKNRELEATLKDREVKTLQVS